MHVLLYMKRSKKTRYLLNYIQHVFLLLFSGTLPIKINCATATFRNPQMQMSQQEESCDQVMNEVAVEFLANNNISTPKGLDAYINYLAGAQRVYSKFFETGSLIIIVQCCTLEALEHLWNDYCSGHLNEVAEKCLVTDQTKNKLAIEAITLHTTILEDDYLACKQSLIELPSE